MRDTHGTEARYAALWAVPTAPTQSLSGQSSIPVFLNSLHCPCVTVTNASVHSQKCPGSAHKSHDYPNSKVVRTSSWPETEYVREQWDGIKQGKIAFFQALEKAAQSYKTHTFAEKVPYLPLVISPEIVNRKFSHGAHPSSQPRKTVPFLGGQR